MFNSIIKNNLNIISFTEYVIIAIVLGLIISIVHIKTSRYRRDFIISLVVLPILVGTIMIMVNGNLGTGIAIAGAFSLVRFRSMPGNAKEIMSVFFAMTIGIVIGAGYVYFALLITIIVSLIILLLHYIKFGNSNNNYKILDIIIADDLDYENIFNSLFNKYVDYYELIKIKTTNLGSMYELKYDIKLKKNIDQKKFIDEIRLYNGNLKVCIYRMENNETL